MDFTRQLNTTFLVLPDQGTPVKLHLVEVRPVVPSDGALSYADDAQNEKFSLLFRGPPDAPLEQNTHTFEHQRIGSFEMFIVPIGCLGQRYCYYEAIFNRPSSGDRHHDFRVQTR